ncbi:hypothetical protein Vafri_18366 [Volvox africanus]|uniref:Uncharacterized protein n=1 Tax=Volvox africanus TaxID=51714 RepID=A0A8J4FBR4_9CHLO|nr:hypothetical protein Vafri_18366 [Volvox africanus]
MVATAGPGPPEDSAKAGRHVLVAFRARCTVRPGKSNRTRSTRPSPPSPNAITGVNPPMPPGWPNSHSFSSWLSSSRPPTADQAGGGVRRGAPPRMASSSAASGPTKTTALRGAPPPTTALWYGCISPLAVLAAARRPRARTWTATGIGPPKSEPRTRIMRSSAASAPSMVVERSAPGGVMYVFVPHASLPGTALRSIENPGADMR